MQQLNRVPMNAPAPVRLVLANQDAFTLVFENGLIQCRSLASGQVLRSVELCGVRVECAERSDGRVLLGCSVGLYCVRLE